MNPSCNMEVSPHSNHFRDGLRNTACSGLLSLCLDMMKPCCHFLAPFNQVASSGKSQVTTTSRAPQCEVPYSAQVPGATSAGWDQELSALQVSFGPQHVALFRACSYRPSCGSQYLSSSKHVSHVCVTEALFCRGVNQGWSSQELSHYFC